MEYAAVIAAAAAGLLLGLMYRVPALIAATALLITVCSGIGLADEWPLNKLVLWTLWLVFTMQAFYLGGVALANFMRSRRD